jgi:hypothetical protein
MKPCDCSDLHTVLTQLNEHGVQYNEYSITVEPSVVIIEGRSYAIRIPQTIFKRFAEWYLEDQEKE